MVSSSNHVSHSRKSWHLSAVSVFAVTESVTIHSYSSSIRQLGISRNIAVKRVHVNEKIGTLKDWGRSYGTTADGRGLISDSVSFPLTPTSFRRWVCKSPLNTGNKLVVSFQHILPWSILCSYSFGWSKYNAINIFIRCTRSPIVQDFNENCIIKWWRYKMDDVTITSIVLSIHRPSNVRTTVSLASASDIQSSSPQYGCRTMYLRVRLTSNS